MVLLPRLVHSSAHMLVPSWAGYIRSMWAAPSPTFFFALLLELTADPKRLVNGAHVVSAMIAWTGLRS